MDDKAVEPRGLYIGTKIVEAFLQTNTGRDGYGVIYEDGYRSWSPAQAFKPYQQLPGPLSFGHALFLCKQGKKIARAGWNGKCMWILLQVPDENSKMTLPYLYIEYPAGHPAYPNGSRVPWLASQTDILSDDWYVVEWVKP